MHNGSSKKIICCCPVCIVVRQCRAELLPELFIAAFVLHQVEINLPFPWLLFTSDILVTCNEPALNARILCQDRVHTELRKLEEKAGD